MARSIVQQLRPLMPLTLTVETPAVTDNFGKVESWETAREIRCRIKNGNRLVRDRNGKEVVSSVQAWLAGVFGVTTADRYTMPSPFTPTNPVAISVGILPDENGVHHEVVMFK